ncbi:hypothetical protein WS65_18860 [Burkholderia anthina]|nr:hypothetical protein WS65_18860 [Burkholderia anthina]
MAILRSGAGAGNDACDAAGAMPQAETGMPHCAAPRGGRALIVMKSRVRCGGAAYSRGASGSPFHPGDSRTVSSIDFFGSRA